MYISTAFRWKSELFSPNVIRLVSIPERQSVPEFLPSAPMIAGIGILTDESEVHLGSEVAADLGVIGVFIVALEPEDHGVFVVLHRGDSDLLSLAYDAFALERLRNDSVISYPVHRLYRNELLAVGGKLHDRKVDVASRVVAEGGDRLRFAGLTVPLRKDRQLSVLEEHDPSGGRKIEAFGIQVELPGVIDCALAFIPDVIRIREIRVVVLAVYAVNVLRYRFDRHARNVDGGCGEQLDVRFLEILRLAENEALAEHIVREVDREVTAKSRHDREDEEDQKQKRQKSDQGSEPVSGEPQQEAAALVEIQAKAARYEFELAAALDTARAHFTA